MSRSTAAALVAGMALDELLGDPRRGHPVAGFGHGAAWLERRLYRPSRTAGAVHAAVAVAVPAALTVAVQRRAGRRATLTAAALYVTLGGRTLRRTATRLARLVEDGDLDGARALAPSLVSRRPDDLTGDDLSRAAFESLAENTADAVVGPLLWTFVLGAPGAVLYRAVNTLDAMVGYRDERYARFGWAAARLDDALNWPVARATAAAVVIAAPLAGADARGALATWRRDGHHHPSPNAGHVEAAFAGALGVRVGGPTTYGHSVEHRAHLGDGRTPEPADVRAAARLSLAATWTLAALLVLASLGRRRR
jgi:adenosylcobinamide-phosphate synthase